MNIAINDKLDALISLTAKECGNDDVEMFNNLDTSKVSLEKRFYLKLRQIISKHKHSAIIFTIKKCLVRLAVALMALMSLGFLTIMATPDLREAIFEAVIEWYDNYISIRYEPVGDDTYDADTTYESIDSSFVDGSENESNSPIVVPPTKIEKVMKPAYIPKGVEEEELLNNNTVVACDYYFGNELLYHYSQILFKDNGKLFDNATIIVANTEINGYNASILEYSHKEGKAIVWTDGLYYYHIHSSFLDLEEIIKIAQSVK